MPAVLLHPEDAAQRGIADGARVLAESARGAAEFQAAVPHARFVDVSGAGHMVAGDRNDLFTEAVIGFLRNDVAR